MGGDRALQATDRKGVGVHARWGRGAAVHPRREVRGLDGHIRYGGMAEVVGACPWAARGAGVKRHLLKDQCERITGRDERTMLRVGVRGMNMSGRRRVGRTSFWCHHGITKERT
jgi:hypothetical protein